MIPTSIKIPLLIPKINWFQRIILKLIRFKPITEYELSLYIKGVGYIDDVLLKPVK